MRECPRGGIKHEPEDGFASLPTDSTQTLKEKLNQTDLQVQKLIN